MACPIARLTLGRGTGLGLSMVIGFVKQSGGQVTLYSEPGLGTTVTLYLPAWRSQPVAKPAEAVEDVPFDRSGHCVLVVEDDAAVRRLQTRVLESLGYQVLDAADGATGLAIIEAASRVDLLLTDIILAGGMSGPELADAAQRRRPDLKIVFMSGYAPGAVLQQHDLSAHPALSKPFTRATLAQVVRNALAG